MNNYDKNFLYFFFIPLVIAVVIITITISVTIVKTNYIIQDSNNFTSCLKYHTPKQCIILRKNG